MKNESSPSAGPPREIPVARRLLAAAMTSWLWYIGARIIWYGEYTGITKRGRVVHLQGAEAYLIGAIFVAFGALLLVVLLNPPAARKLFFWVVMGSLAALLVVAVLGR